MDATFHKIDLETWERREEYEYFSRGGCGFTMTAELDITHLRRYAKEHGAKLYPMLVAVAAQAVNAHPEFRYGWSEEDEFVCYNTMHPLFFDVMENGNVKCLVAEYIPDALRQVEEIERVRAEYADVNKYNPQGAFPLNSVNISAVPWIKTSNISFCLQYCATFYPPILTFGKFEERDGKTVIPLTVYCNHAVNDGYHCAMLFQDFQRRADGLE